MWHYWISETVEGDENVKRDKTVEFAILLNMWECWMRYECEIDNKLNFWEGCIFETVEWDYTVESDKTVEFVTLLNMLEL